MKTINPVYALKWFGSVILAAVVLTVIGIIIDQIMLITIAIFGGFIILMLMPSLFMENAMKKKAALCESKFAEMDFTYQYKFIAKNGIFYIDANGRLGVVCKYNPEFQLVDVTKITDICTHDGRHFNGGTNMVSCRFMIDGKKVKIPTFTTNARGGWSMKSAEVLEAISKADKLCEMLTMAKQNATVK